MGERNSTTNENYNKYSLTNFNNKKKRKLINLKKYNSSIQNDDISKSIKINDNNNINIERIKIFKRVNNSEKKRKKIKIFNPKSTSLNKFNNENIKSKDKYIIYRNNIKNIKNIKNINNNKINTTYINKTNNNFNFNSSNNLRNLKKSRNINGNNSTISKENKKDINICLINKLRSNSSYMERKMNIKKDKEILIPKSYQSKEKYIINMQDNYRRYIFQKHLCNDIPFYKRYIKAIFIINKLYLSKIRYFMIQLKLKIKKNKIDHSMNFNNKYNNEIKLRMKKILKENNELKLESIDYKMYKDKYNEIIEEYKKIQAKNNFITKQNIELMKQLKEVKDKNKVKINNETLKENSKKKQIVTNNYNIQSQVNIIMSDSKISKKEVTKKINIKSNDYKEKQEKQVKQ